MAAAPRTDETTVAVWQRHDGQYVTAVSILRDSAQKIKPGVNVELQHDTLFALIDGYVVFQRKGKNVKQVSVLTEVTA